jgi:hypothetical protein
VLVYHFLSERWALEDLAKKRLKIALFDELNDPFELLGLNLSDEELRRAFQRSKNRIAKANGLLCFSRSWHNPVLWSHYADKHKGICLAFEIPDHRLLSVSYTGERLIDEIPLLLRGDEAAEDVMKKLLATKFKHWEYKDEVRAFVGLDEIDSTGFYFKDFSEDTVLKEVILGVRCKTSKGQIKRLVSSYASSTRIVKARLAFHTFRVVENLAARRTPE